MRFQDLQIVKLYLPDKLQNVLGTAGNTVGGCGGNGDIVAPVQYPTNPVAITVYADLDIGMFPAECIILNAVFKLDTNIDLFVDNVKFPKAVEPTLTAVSYMLAI